MGLLSEGVEEALLEGLLRSQVRYFLFGHLAQWDALGVGDGFAVGRIGLQAVAGMPELDRPGGVAHGAGGVGFTQPRPGPG